MENPVNNYWELRLNDLKESLEDNNFEVFIAESAAAAKDIVLGRIIPALSPGSVSWGGSMSMVAAGLYDALKDSRELEVIDTYDKTISKEGMVERRRQALLADLFITGTNAVTEEGWLVNLDMIGNRVAAITFGPKNVVVVVGRNKIVPGLEEAFDRIKDYVAPVNTMRLDKKTPCRKTGICHDCSSPDRICNVWGITEKSFPQGRIKVVLVNEDLGF
ncbi:lactate utilization protein [Salidesulfovibrio onnuriiensis]|uniref:lactate utilization protein n=1 Tax=Salidesulfovibrio onnuriiensis TaxID=2583823 RepID=UPI0011CA44C4|nr:lactate utilization protein [Salidesulfovibrio onnuriiensis]